MLKKIRIPALGLGMLLLSALAAWSQPFGCHHHDHDLLQRQPDLRSINDPKAWAARSDSFDILHYTIRLDVPASGNHLQGETKIRFRPRMAGLDTIRFDLAKFTVDSVKMDGADLSFVHEDPFLIVQLPAALPIGDTTEVTVFYQGTPLRDPVWGGFYFESGYAYNLGIGISSNPPNFGRAWYPCFDNFVERATYDIHLLTHNNRRGYAIGDFISETDDSLGNIERHYRMEQLLPTYLTNVAVADYVAHRDTHYGAYGPVPIELLGRPSHFSNMVKAFGRLGDAIDAIEHWYGPYPWSRVGYVLTTAGAMEHPTNTAFPVNSINNGAGDVRLMTHELGHHWWGNITTLEAPTDMWIKEGNAEYCAHLIDEWSEGRQAFVNTVRSNHQFVLTQVHQLDGGFLPLSNIPFERIYGRHTYLKGASVLHNMRGYLGDSLFMAGQRDVLATYAYQAIDAPTYRDHLSMVTGVDMGPFFDAWLLNPGFASFVVQDWSVSGSGNDPWVSLTLRQGLRAAPDYHEQVPVEVSFYSADWQQYRTTVLAGGAFSQHQIQVPFVPVHLALNEGYTLNQARLDHQRVITEPGNYVYPYVRFRVNALSVQDSALVRVDHQWIAPEPPLNQPELTLSGTNYWVVSGIFPEGFQAQGRLSYDANGANAFLDQDLAGINEDSLLLLYRPSAAVEWQEHPDYSMLKFAPTDGRGDVVINGLKPGEYALARGQFISVSLETPRLEEQVLLYPNPARGPVFLQWKSEQSLPVMVRWYDALGREMGRTALQPASGVQELAIPSGAKGLLHVVLEGSRGEMVHKTLLRH